MHHLPACLLKEGSRRVDLRGELVTQGLFVNYSLFCGVEEVDSLLQCVETGFNMRDELVASEFREEYEIVELVKPREPESEECCIAVALKELTRQIRTPENQH